jgi:hypothetical protein
LSSLRFCAARTINFCPHWNTGRTANRCRSPDHRQRSIARLHKAACPQPSSLGSNGRIPSPQSFAIGAPPFPPSIASRCARAPLRARPRFPVSWAATIRPPEHAAAVRSAAVFRISCGVTCGESRKRCAAISPARSPPIWRKTNDPVSTTRSNKAAPACSRRTSPKKPIRNLLSPPIPAPRCRPDGQRITP